LIKLFNPLVILSVKNNNQQCNWEVNSCRALWKIPTEFFVGNSLYNLHDEHCSQFTNEQCLQLEFIPLVKSSRHRFFFALFNYYFSHYNSLDIYQGNIVVNKIGQKVTDEKIPSVVPFCIYRFSGSEIWQVYSFFISFNSFFLLEFKRLFYFSFLS
jgi:hypothetical protein